ncbi:MAG TPA: lysoplasmalogenase family protein, partial [Magnetospirillaceae bacterium]|nr:lysoplasmalogenase family protein [Magnetospirillaceae bacterium]
MHDSWVFLSLVPAGTAAGFLLHWLTIRGIGSAEERLPHCRGAYLAFSAQLTLFAWAVGYTAGFDRPAALLLPLGMTASSLGDYFNLQFPAVRKRVREPVFLGILCFSVAQILYIGTFLTLVPFSELVGQGRLYPLLAVFL